VATTSLLCGADLLIGDDLIGLSCLGAAGVPDGAGGHEYARHAHVCRILGRERGAAQAGGRSDVAAKTAGPIGATFTFVALVTGSLWGKPMWGTYWVWDARLTSVLVLFLLYLGLLALWQAIEEPGRAGRAAAILALVGAVNVPIIHYSVVWWNTLHQPASVFRVGGPSIDPSLLAPLLVMALAFTLLFILLHLISMRAEILRRRVRALQQTQVERAALVEV